MRSSLRHKLSEIHLPDEINSRTAIENSNARFRPHQSVERIVILETHSDIFSNTLKSSRIFSATHSDIYTCEPVYPRMRSKMLPISALAPYPLQRITQKQLEIMAKTAALQLPCFCVDTMGRPLLEPRTVWGHPATEATLCENIPRSTHHVEMREERRGHNIAVVSTSE